MAPPATQPVFEELAAPPGWETVDFISDLHLSAQTPRGFEAWSRWMNATKADAVIILGDLFDAWIGDDSRHTGFEAQCAEVLRTTAAARYVAVMVGNRDFLIGPGLAQACGLHLLADPTVLAIGSERLVLTHGDELCVADTEYQQFRRQVRSPSWQRQFLALPLSERRVQARRMREQSAMHHKSQPAGQWFDVDGAAAMQWIKASRATCMIHGHTHRPATQRLAPGWVRHVLSDWDLDHAPVPRAEVLRWQQGSVTRLPVGP